MPTIPPTLRFVFFYDKAKRSSQVHRNWMAITLHKPLAQWYTDTTSQWTLDYPPLFAFFERALASVAYRVDSNITTLQTLPYESWTTTMFMRFTVLLCALLYCTIALWCARLVVVVGVRWLTIPLQTHCFV